MGQKRGLWGRLGRGLPGWRGSLEPPWAMQAPLAGRQHHPASWDLGDSQGVRFIQLIKLPIYGLFNFWYLCYISQ